ncbi:hypothetical protein FB451DRAFT_1470017 [Mycena latifolia]|nr:hypothetical protein FB451DRAFT_1470017 [Mycena latifolia]
MVVPIGSESVNCHKWQHPNASAPKHPVYGENTYTPNNIAPKRPTRARGPHFKFGVFFFMFLPSFVLFCTLPCAGKVGQRGVSGFGSGPGSAKGVGEVVDVEVEVEEGSARVEIGDAEAEAEAEAEVELQAEAGVEVAVGEVGEVGEEKAEVAMFAVEVGVGHVALDVEVGIDVLQTDAAAGILAPSASTSSSAVE